MRVWQACLGVLLGLSLVGCAAEKQRVHGMVQDKQPVIEKFQGRLLVMTPKHRFQVLIQWQASLSQGAARLTHAASGRIVDVRWRNHAIDMRDNQVVPPRWQPVNREAWAKMGIVLEPWVLARILHGDMPESLQKQGDERWQGKLNGSVVRVRWQKQAGVLTMIDVSKGQKAVLRMNP